MTTINNNSNNANNTRSTAATYFYFDHIAQQIKGSELNFKKAGNPNAPQYEALMAAKELQPTYTLTPIAPKVKKQTYAGLTTDLMREYVAIKGTPAQLEELDTMIADEDAYPTIKSWFLDYFKCGFTVEKAKDMIAYHKLNARKSKVRATVRAKSIKATPAVVEMPVAQNF